MNIAQHVERAARLFPDKPAIIFEGAQLSYADLNTRANRVANALKANGVQRGDRVALYLPNIPQFAVCYLAILKAGALAVSINAILKAEEVKYILDDSEAKVLFTIGDLLPNVPDRSAGTARISAQSGSPHVPDRIVGAGLVPAQGLPLQIVVCAGDAQGHPTLDDWLSRGASEATALDMQPHEPALLLYTSGTTGFPKGATLTHGNVVSNMWATMHHVGYRPADRMALFLPLFHVFGQNFIMNAAFNACATVALYRRFVPDQVLDSIQRDRVSMLFAVPTIYISLLNLDLSRWDLSSIRYDFSAAATMPQEVSRRWTERFGRPVYEGYGLTETSPFACYNHDFRHKFGSVGTAVENFELKILDEEDHERPLGQWGEICIKGPGVMQGYWGRPEDSGRALRNGWFHSGDIGVMDDENYVFIVDRVKDMINVSGFKVWPAEVEQFMYRHPAINEVAVFGVPDELKGERVKASIVLKDGAAATSEELIAYCRERMAVYKVPESVEFVAELPKSATGKILKRVLRAQ